VRLVDETQIGQWVDEGFDFAAPAP
jgi:hypothetical protein